MIGLWSRRAWVQIPSPPDFKALSSFRKCFFFVILILLLKNPIDNRIFKKIGISKDMKFFGMKKIKVNNLSLEINHNQLFESLGDNYKKGAGYEQITYTDDIGLYRFTFNEEDSLITVSLNFIKK